MPSHATSRGHGWSTAHRCEANADARAASGSRCGAISSRRAPYGATQRLIASSNAACAAYRYANRAHGAAPARSPMGDRCVRCGDRWYRTVLASYLTPLVGRRRAIGSAHESSRQRPIAFLYLVLADRRVPQGARYAPMARRDLRHGARYGSIAYREASLAAPLRAMRGSRLPLDATSPSAYRRPPVPYGLRGVRWKRRVQSTLRLVDVQQVRARPDTVG
jgi:hypothetical protein